MGNQKLVGKDLRLINYSSDVTISLAMNMVNKHFRHTPKEEKLRLLAEVLASPESFLNHEIIAPLAMKMTGVKKDTASVETYELDEEPKHFEVFGHKHIEGNTMRQMQLAMRLPVAAYGALMPDAHYGYGLPVGSVLATQRAVIPYGVGMDIGCRMALSILDLPGSYVDHHAYELKRALQEFTHFGNEGGLEFAQDNEVLDHPHFLSTALLRQLHGKAVRQLGSSGSGNHFVEFGVVELADDNTLQLPAGSYAGLLSHSGSRSLGAAIAKHYTTIAMNKCKLPREAKHLAWLDLDSAEGEEYWLSMNLAGDYSQACHQRIHSNLCRALGVNAVKVVENHHNFAWKEKFADGNEYIVHRKGATPASKEVYGIIPGSMTTPGYIVRGLGNALALNSASHGAGRKMSRLKAKESITMGAMKKMLQSARVTLIGGSPEEAPIAYKDIDMIMKSQSTLVTVEGKFHPRVVRMAKD